MGDNAQRALRSSANVKDELTYVTLVPFAMRLALSWSNDAKSTKQKVESILQRNDLAAYLNVLFEGKAAKEQLSQYLKEVQKYLCTRLRVEPRDLRVSHPRSFKQGDCSIVYKNVPILSFRPDHYAM